MLLVCMFLLIGINRIDEHAKKKPQNKKKMEWKGMNY